jgi:glycosyltransferase involved in cell wall biosynthesis
MDCEINYSIIIPHKNIPGLLERCLASVPRRDDVQILIIDDNSDPGKVNFDKFPGAGDPYMEIAFTKEGKGAGYARNVGLTKAAGKWLLFADADDYFTDGFFGCLDKYKDSDYDLIYFGIDGVRAGKKQKNIRGRYYDQLMKNVISNKKKEQYKYTSVEPWGKMIKRTLTTVNDITFDETKVSNDAMFSLRTAYYAKKIFFDEHKIYVYESRQGSAVSTLTLETNFDRFYVSVHINKFLENIEQKKFKINLIPALCRLINIRDMTYFCKGLRLLKDNKIGFLEFTGFFLLMPHLIIRKTKNKLLDKIGA